MGSGEPGEESSSRAVELRAEGMEAFEAGDYDRAAALLNESLDLQRDCEDREELAETLWELASVFRARGEIGAAEEYLHRSLEWYQTREDRLGEATVLRELGQIALEQGKYERAQNYSEAAAELCLRIRAYGDLARACVNVVRTTVELNDPEATVEWCKRGLDAIERTDSGDFDEERAVFEDVLERIRIFGGVSGGLLANGTFTTTPTPELYDRGLLYVLNGRGDAAMETLYGVWTRREGFEPDSQVYPTILAAGVGFAAHTTLFDSEDAAADRHEVLDTVEPHRERLRKPAAAVFEHLSEGGTDVTPADLRVDVPDDADELEAEHVEPAAFARLLDILTGEIEVVARSAND